MIISQALSHEKVSVQACQARLEAAAREIAAANESANAARAAAKKSGEEAAELRGQLAAKKPLTLEVATLGGTKWRSKFAEYIK